MDLLQQAKMMPVSKIFEARFDLELDPNSGLYLPPGAQGVSNIKSGVQAQASKTLATSQSFQTTEIPSEYLITLGEYTFISQEWLAYVPPPQSFSDQGGTLLQNEKVGGEDWSKPYCWSEKYQGKTIYRYSQPGETLLAECYGGYMGGLDIDYQGEIRALYDSIDGTHEEKVLAMKLQNTGWRYSVNGSIDNRDWSIVRSASQNANGHFRSLWFLQSKSTPGHSWDWHRTGMVPLVFMGKKRSK